jgi:hypothetical protein
MPFGVKADGFALSLTYGVSALSDIRAHICRAYACAILVSKNEGNWVLEQIYKALKSTVKFFIQKPSNLMNKLKMLVDKYFSILRDYFGEASKIARAN